MLGQFVLGVQDIVVVILKMEPCIPSLVVDAKGEQRLDALLYPLQLHIFVVDGFQIGRIAIIL